MITCEFEDGGKGKLRHVTVNAVVVKDGKILLGKRGTLANGKPLLEAGKWSLLGGFMGRDETLVEGLRREIMEESGWNVGDFTLLHIKDNPDRSGEERQNIEFVFITKALDKTGESDCEVTALEWFDVNTLPDEQTVAFDHYDDLILYQDYLAGKIQSLPYLGKYKNQ
ncbi:MAG: Bifunctional NMN adenylyltransferase/Nudix hydrolase [Microgenomates bacterium OLB23]|nr:MAG: Bifunctional NMN adenylyltransferase/Nudix hydrolase [Microgenomates bacterium OLB23]